jgi:2-keto-4-pentenoate hydratase/2-oxohepta-3-ene-1,7-dioic acid hydratase in catechol pathway
MRLASHRRPDGRESFGIVEDGALRDLGGAEGGALIDFLMLSSTDRHAAVAAAKARPIALADVAFLPVIPNPGKVVCLGLNYAEHAREGGFTVPDYPALFLRVTSSLVGNGGAIIRPACSELLDYEAEMAVVIGKRGKHLTAGQALDYVAGYTAFNDASVRDYQRRTAQWTPGKNFDATGALGPVLVTADDLPAGGEGLHIESRLNGQVMQSSNTSNMIFGVARTIEILSEVMTLEPGDVIAMGTPPGVGHARKPPVWMRDGDVCEIEVEGIGILRNPVRDEVLVPA